MASASASASAFAFASTAGTLPAQLSACDGIAARSESEQQLIGLVPKPASVSVSVSAAPAAPAAPSPACQSPEAVGVAGPILLAVGRYDVNGVAVGASSPATDFKVGDDDSGDEAANGDADADADADAGAGSGHAEPATTVAIVADLLGCVARCLLPARAKVRFVFGAVWGWGFLMGCWAAALFIFWGRGLRWYGEGDDGELERYRWSNVALSYAYHGIALFLMWYVVVLSYGTPRVRPRPRPPWFWSSGFPLAANALVEFAGYTILTAFFGGPFSPAYEGFFLASHVVGVLAMSWSARIIYEGRGLDRLSAPRLAHLLLGLICMMLVVVVSQLFARYVFFADGTSDALRGAVRVLAWPLLCEAGYAAVRTALRAWTTHPGADRDQDYLIGQCYALYAATVGRVFMASIVSPGALVLSCAATGLQEVLFRVTQRRRDFWLTRVRLGSAADANKVLDDHEYRRSRARAVLVEVMAEVCAIVAAPWLVWSFHTVRPAFDFGIPSDWQPDFVNMAVLPAMQLGIEALVDIVCLSYEQDRAGLPMIQAVRRVPFGFAAYTMTTVALVSASVCNSFARPY